MFCPHCGKDLPDDAVFCAECGSKLKETAIPKKEPVVIDNGNKPVSAKGAVLILVLGIVALKISPLGIPGIIVAAIALSKAKAFIEANGQIWGMAKVGRILARVARPISIVMTVFWAIYITAIVVLVILAVNGVFNSTDIPSSVDIIGSSDFPEINVYW